MCDSDYKILWIEALKQLREEGQISDQEYDMWFRNMTFEKAQNGSLVLGVPSNFYRDQVTHRYVPMLESKLHELIGSSIAIQFNISKRITEKNIKKAVKNQIDNHVNDKVKRKPHTQLREDYDFDGFVIGANNTFAANAAQAISTNPGGTYNPFLIYGGVGLGKTHLMQAIGNSIHYSIHDKKVVYITAETFITEFIQSIRTENQNNFKNKYRKVDVLLIDDIHDLQNKKETQEELFHTFNALYDAKKQLVFTCDRPPSELKNFTHRLRSRFERGLNVDLQPPNFETRNAILRKKLESANSNIPEDVIDLIARNVTTNVRDLEASLTKMMAYSELVGKDITIEVAQQQLKGTFSGTIRSNITIGEVQKVISEYFNITPGDMKGKKRTSQIVFPRQVAMYIIREITDYSTTEIGLEFGGRDHTTVMYACQRIEEKMMGDATLEPIVSDLIRTIKEGE